MSEEARVSAEALYRAHAPFVAGFLARLGTPREELADLVQEVFVIVHRRGGFVSGTARPTTWLAEIALRVNANARRSRARRPMSMGTDALALLHTTEADPERRALAAASVARVQRCVDQLDEDQRAVFLLYEVAGESTVDIAAALAIPVGTVHSRLHAARKRFADAWQRAELRDGEAADEQPGSKGP